MIRMAPTLLTILLLAQTAWTQEPPKPPGMPNLDLTDSKAVLGYVRYNVELVLQDANLGSSMARLQELERVLSRLPRENVAQKNVVAQVTKFMQMCREKVVTQGTPLATLIEQVRANPDDPVSLNRLTVKSRFEIDSKYIDRPDEAAQHLAALKAALDGVEQAQISDATKRVLASSRRWVTSLEHGISVSFDFRQKQRDKVGQDAVPLVVETWLNGAPLGQDDLKGKVVLLDFFSAVNLIPGLINYEDWREHLVQLGDWQTKYGPRGLLVIGVTKYYNLRWDERARSVQRVSRSTEVVLAADERAMLTKLAETHKLKHPIAIQTKEEHAKATAHYPAFDHPHLVVIDRQNKIRLIRGGASEQFAREIGAELEALLGANANETK